jgi:hypothetical protein
MDGKNRKEKKQKRGASFVIINSGRKNGTESRSFCYVIQE